MDYRARDKKKPYELDLRDIWKREQRKMTLKQVVFLPYLLFRSISISGQKTYYPELERKNRLERILDNMAWSIENLEPNMYYTSYGLDIKNFHDPKDYLPYREFKLSREGAHYSTPSGRHYDSKILLRDKYIFSCYLESALGVGVVPKTLGVLENDYIEEFDTKQRVSIEDFISKHPRFFCKLIDGECADSVLLIQASEGKLWNGKEEISIDGIKKAVSGGRYILQNVVEQHELVNRINPSCINTIRIITIRGKSGAINVFAASMRIGVSKDSFVDNRAAGGMAVGITEEGKLKKYGFQHVEFGGKSEKHPVTGTVFEGYQLPFWKEVVDLVTKAHGCFRGIQSIGWDVAITPTGPILIEGNDNWEVPNPQDSHGGLKKRWYDLINS